MGSGSSRLETRWWEAEAQRKIATTKSTSRVEVICSLIPGMDETTVKGYLKARSDLDVLFELNCRSQNPSREQHADHSNLTADSKVNGLWRILRMPLGYGKPLWNWNWRVPLEGIPSEIAAEFHAAVCQAIFRIPLSDFVDCALGYNTKVESLDKLFVAVCKVRHSLRTEYERHPGTMDTYVEVEKVSRHESAEMKY